jgi:glyoxalase family protein
MDKEILGIHHITAIAGDPQGNIDFYAGLLGLRLIKVTVNYDDPGTYHFYYGDGAGNPGTIITFFPWPDAPRGRHGTGQVTETAFAVPVGAIDYWAGRLSEYGTTFDGPFQRFGEQAISFSDPDGLKIELIESEHIRADRINTYSRIPPESAIHGFHSATLAETGHQKTSSLLTETMGFRLIGEEGNRFRYIVGTGGTGMKVDILCKPELERGAVLVGTVHHIAWRTADDAQQSQWLDEIIRLGYNSSPIMNRNYFHSIYFREPGGILFEIATDLPGFAIDEPLEELGGKLSLPAWLEHDRVHIESGLPTVDLHPRIHAMP